MMSLRLLARLTLLLSWYVVLTRSEVTVESADTNRIHPWVDRYPGVIPKAVTAAVIEECEYQGFELFEDSIDKLTPDEAKPSQDLYVYDEGEDVDDPIILPKIYGLIEPYLPVLADLVRQRKERTTGTIVPTQPHAGWIFIRKYSPASPRNSLLVHMDSNQHSVNVPLNGNDEFEGGGFFYIHEVQNKVIRKELRSHEWVNTLPRQNTSEVTFPEMHAGDAILHNNTVWHGIAPLITGTKYSLCLFFDMSHEDHYLDRDDDDDDEFFDAFYGLYVSTTSSHKPGKHVLTKGGLGTLWHELLSCEGDCSFEVRDPTGALLAQGTIRANEPKRRDADLRKLLASIHQNYVEEGYFDADEDVGNGR